MSDYSKRWKLLLSIQTLGLLTILSILIAVSTAHATANVWESVGDLTKARKAHTATLLQDGLVLVVGGDSDTGASAELYDPSTGTWSTAGSLNTPRRGHTATLLPDGPGISGWGKGKCQRRTLQPVNRNLEHHWFACHNKGLSYCNPAYGWPGTSSWGNGYK